MNRAQVSNALYKQKYPVAALQEPQPDILYCHQLVKKFFLTSVDGGEAPPPLPPLLSFH
jgi:hypothetical protein